MVFLGRVLIVSKHDSLFLATGDIALYSCFYKIPLISSFLFMREDGKYYFQYNTDQLNIIISTRRLKIHHWIDSKHKLNKNGTFSITSFISDLSVSLWILYISRAKAQSMHVPNLTLNSLTLNQHPTSLSHQYVMVSPRLITWSKQSWSLMLICRIGNRDQPMWFFS